MLRQLRDRFDGNRRLDLVTADRAGVEHAEKPRFVQCAEQGLGDAVSALDLVGGSGDSGGEIARPRHRAPQT